MITSTFSRKIEYAHTNLKRKKCAQCGSIKQGKVMEIRLKV